MPRRQSSGPGAQYARAIREREQRLRARYPNVKRFGVTEPRICTPPLRPLTPETTAGFSCIEFAEDILGIDLMPWQAALLLRALELLDDGTFRFRTVVLLVARQNGKSTLAQVLALFFLYVRAAGLVIGTAQNLDIAKEVWQGAVEIAQDVPELAELVDGVPRTTNGQIEFRLVTGEKYKVQTATRRGGRGLSGDLVILDELREHQSWDAWGAVSKTTLARVYAQIWALSNAGDATSVVLRHLRKRAHAAVGDPDGINRDPASGESDPIADLDETCGTSDLVNEASASLGIFEWSALPECAVLDRDAWASANPSLGYGTLTERALVAAADSDPEWVFRTECLCQWSEGALIGPFPPSAWEKALDAESQIPPDAPISFGLDVSADRTHSHIAVAGRRSDGDWHVEVVASRIGIDWALDWFRERANPDAPLRVAVQGRGAPASGLIADLSAIAGVEVLSMVGPDLGIASGRLWDMIAAHVADDNATSRTRVWHRGQPVLDTPAATAATRPVGDGAWTWDRVRSPADAAPIVAITNALWDATRAPTPDKYRSAYEDAELMMLD